MSTIGSAKGSHSTQYVVCRKAEGCYGQIYPFLAPPHPRTPTVSKRCQEEPTGNPEVPHGGTAGRSMFNVTP